MKLYEFVLSELLVIGIFILFMGYGCQSESTNRMISQEVQWEDDRLNNFKDWAIYRGDKEGNQYSELDQINTENVSMLGLAWEYETVESVSLGMQSSPIIVNKLMDFSDPKRNWWH